MNLSGHLILVMLSALVAVGCEKGLTEKKSPHRLSSPQTARDSIRTFHVDISTFFGAAGYTLEYRLTGDSLHVLYSNDFGQRDTVIRMWGVTAPDRERMRGVLGGMELDTFTSSYRNPYIMDGLSLGLDITINDSLQRKIGIGNYYVKDLTPLFEMMDRMIPDTTLHIKYRAWGEGLEKLQKMLNEGNMPEE